MPSTSQEHNQTAENFISTESIDDENKEDEGFTTQQLFSFAWQIARGMVTFFVLQNMKYTYSTQGNFVSCKYELRPKCPHVLHVKPPKKGIIFPPFRKFLVFCLLVFFLSASCIFWES